MRSFLKKFILITLPTLLLLVIMLEIVIRFLPVSDYPVYHYDENELWHLEPNQEGRWVKGWNGQVFNVPFTTNAQGWHAPIDYRMERTNDTLRIAVIGDSFVEAMQVHEKDSFPYVLQAILEETHSVEVYSFGVSGASLSHYLHMMRYAAETYQPDIYIINLVENDFDESFAETISRPYFLQLEWPLREIPPTSFSVSQVRRTLNYSALVRYVTINLGYNSPQDIRNRLNEALQGETAEAESLPTEAIWLPALLEYTFSQFQAVAGENHLLITMDGPRYGLHDLTWEQVQTLPAYHYHPAVAQTTTDLNIPFLDLSRVFFEDFQATGQTIGFQGDGHWTERGHELAAEAIAEELRARGWLQ